MSKIARITNDKKVFLGEEIIEYPPELEGGRNLVRNSDFSIDDLSSWSPIYGVHEIENGVYVKTLTGDANASRVEYLTQILEPGTYTFSMLAKSKKGFRYDRFDGTEYQLKKIYGNSCFQKSDITFRVVESQVVAIRMYYINPEIGDTMEIKWVKLEKGSQATPWTPAPEDLGLIYPSFITRFGTYFKNNALATQEIIEYPPELEGGRNLLLDSEQEKTGTREYLMYANLAPLFDAYGVGIYTFSFDLKSEIAGDINVYYSDRVTSNIKYRWSPGSKMIPTTTEFQRCSFTVDVSLFTESANHCSLAFYGTYDSGRIPSVKNVKIEKGTQATPWTPAPEDLGLAYPDNIQSFGLKLSQSNRLMVRELIEYPKELLNSGRNLALDSYWNESNSKYLFKEFQTSKPLLVGNVYTLRIYGQLAEEKTKFVLYSDIGYSHFKNLDGKYYGGYLVNLGNGIYETTFVYHFIDGYEPRRHDVFRIYATLSTEVGESYIEKIKLEKGTQATPWTPAPEDLGYNI